MSRPWFDETTGLLKLDDYMIESASFRKIMEDGIVTDDEVCEHAERLEVMLRELEAALPENERDKTLDVLCELGVLYAIQRTREQQVARNRG